MMKVKSLIAAVLLMFSASAMAQATYTAADGTKYEFQKHLFLNLEGGAQYTLGEAKFKDLLSPNVQLGLGYQFSPVFAARLQANGWQSKGGWSAYRANKGDMPYTNDYKYKYVAPGIDLMFNLTNLIGGYNPFRTVNLTAFLGGGANIAWDNNEVNDIAKTLTDLDGYLLDYVWDGTKVRPYGRAGLELGFRLSDAVNLVVEGNANILSDKYNSKKADRKLKSDWYFNALVGLRINLGKTYNKIVPPAPVPEPEPVVEPEPQPQPKPVVKIEPLRREVFFVINKAIIRDSEAGKISDIAEYLKEHQDAKVNICGYADAGTGNDRINDRLARQRADAVVKALIEKYEIPADRISYDSKGAREQPFAENDKNRVTIMIAE